MGYPYSTEKNMQDDEAQVAHPQHYCQGKREVIELTEQLDFCFGNALKYILRAPYKGQEVRDIKKARWYIQRMMTKELLPEFKSDDEGKCVIYDIVKDYENPLLEAVVDAVVEAAIKGDASLLQKAVDVLTDHIKELEYYGMRKELQRCKEELRKVQEGRLLQEVRSTEPPEVGEVFFHGIPLRLFYPWMKM